MSQQTLREVVEEASSAINTYTSPSIREARDALNTIINAAGLGNLEYESIDGISFHDGTVEVNTTYSTRGCVQSGEYIFPESLLDEAEPETAAKRWGLEKKVSEAQERVDEVRRELERCEESLEEAKAALAAFDASA